ncbi:MAG: suppressor of fused domain protein, partial [Pirellulaceae bacterium]
LLNAAKEGHDEVVEYLLSAGINANATYRIPSGALINAMTDAKRSQNAKVIELLKSHGCHEPVEGVDIPIWEPEEFRNKQVPIADLGREIIDYMEQRFGPVDQEGLQEIIPVMEGLSVAINVIRPNDLHPYFVLFTNGMSDLPMKVPAGSERWKFAELVIHLPADWIHPRDANSDPRWMWPVKWLREMAYYPHLNDTWLGLPAAIVSSAEPPEPLGPGTEQSCLLMIPDFANLDPPLVRADGSQVHFFTMVPLYSEERDYEQEYGMKEFFKRFSARKVPMTVDLNRPRMTD